MAFLAMFVRFLKERGNLLPHSPSGIRPGQPTAVGTTPPFSVTGIPQSLVSEWGKIPGTLPLSPDLETPNLVVPSSSGILLPQSLPEHSGLPVSTGYAASGRTVQPVLSSVYTGHTSVLGGVTSNPGPPVCTGPPVFTGTGETFVTPSGCTLVSSGNHIPRTSTSAGRSLSTGTNLFGPLRSHTLLSEGQRTPGPSPLPATSGPFRGSAQSHTSVYRFDAQSGPGHKGPELPMATGSSQPPLGPPTSGPSGIDGLRTINAKVDQPMPDPGKDILN